MENRDITGSDSAGKSVEELQERYIQMLLSLLPDRFPNLVSIPTEMDPAAVTEDDQFEYALCCLLDGMEAEMEAAKAAPQRPSAGEEPAASFGT
jgi:hypothetical protein